MGKTPGFYFRLVLICSWQKLHIFHLYVHPVSSVMANRKQRCCLCVEPLQMGGVILTSKGGEANTRYRWKETVLTTAASAVQVFFFLFFF